MGFSLLGLLLSAAVLGPNLVLVVAPARHPAPARVPAALTALERAGQAACLVVPAITVPGTVRPAWLVPAILSYVAYLAVWARYLRSGRDLGALYRSWGPLPVPGAVFPVLTFLAGAVWLGDPWIALAAALLAAGHIPSSLLVARSLRGSP